MEHSPENARSVIREMQELKSKYALHVYSDLSYIYNCLMQAQASPSKLSYQLGNFLIKLEILENENKQLVITSTRRDEHTYLLLPLENHTLRNVLELAQQPNRYYMLGVLRDSIHSEWLQKKAIIITHVEVKETDDERKDRLIKQIYGKLDEMTTLQLATLVNDIS